MLKPLSVLAGLLMILRLETLAQGAPPGPSPERIKAAITKSLPLLENSAAEYTDHRDCFSCHHQALPVLALSLLQPRGFRISAEGLQKQLQFTADSLAKNQDN